MKANCQSIFGALKLLGTTLISMTAMAEVTTIATLPNSYNDAINFNRNGNLYISNIGEFDQNGQLTGTEIYKVRQDGTVTIGLGDLSGPIGNTFDSRGNFYIASLNNGNIFKRSRLGHLEQLSTIPASVGGGMAYHPKRGLLVTSCFDGGIYQIDRYGSATVFSDDPLLAACPIGITFDRQGNMYVGNYSDGRIIKFDKDGNISVLATLDIAGNNIGYLVFAAGHLYTTSLATNKIYKVTLEGEVSEFAGSGGFGNQDGANEEATFGLPNGITTDRNHSAIYITEYFSPHVRKITINQATPSSSPSSNSNHQ
ncbi:hypothetical protein [Pleionea sp. CnH1-48]|uniref:hypothetical protein n=1 Tax=Pleionea sp. CnH1-48 TaxID=2954494 RepID=UPI002097FA59|nr:hypothetical protein [Pleionea sp. CnH1-48]MCO7226396.1 hypothetical protein [Pleionea sp. CnH1-48]